MRTPRIPDRWRAAGVEAAHVLLLQTLASRPALTPGAGSAAPDLTISNVRAVANSETDRTSLTVTVTNAGNLTAGPFDLKIGVFNDTTSASTTFRVAGLLSGGSQTYLPVAKGCTRHSRLPAGRQAKAGIQPVPSEQVKPAFLQRKWTPACAGVTAPMSVLNSTTGSYAASFVGTQWKCGYGSADVKNEIADSSESNNYRSDNQIRHVFFAGQMLMDAIGLFNPPGHLRDRSADDQRAVR